jgi:hypothetical protein
MVYSRVPANTTFPFNAPVGTSINLSEWAQASGVTSDPQKIADALDAQLMHGTMSAQMRASLVQAANAVPAADPQVLLRRVQAEAYLVLSSSQYQVER